MLVGSDSMNGNPFDQGGLYLPLPPVDMDHPTEPSLISTPEKQALQRLVSRSAPQDELPSVIETVVSNVKAVDIVNCLKGDDAQTFIDVIDEVCHHTISWPRSRFVDLFQPSNFYRWSGVRESRFRTTNPKEMFEIVIQDV